MKRPLLALSVLAAAGYGLTLPGQSCCALPHYDPKISAAPTIHLDNRAIGFLAVRRHNLERAYESGRR